MPTWGGSAATIVSCPFPTAFSCGATSLDPSGMRPVAPCATSLAGIFTALTAAPFFLRSARFIFSLLVILPSSCRTAARSHTRVRLGFSAIPNCPPPASRPGLAPDLVMCTEVSREFDVLAESLSLNSKPIKLTSPTSDLVRLRPPRLMHQETPVQDAESRDSWPPSSQRDTLIRYPCPSRSAHQRP